jgi:uncharacterized protein (TIGR03437 family)
MQVSGWVMALGMCVAPVYGQVIDTVAGTTWFFPASSVQALSAPLAPLKGLAVDAQGNVYASDSEDNIVVRISPGGVLTVVAGNGNFGFSGDGGPATTASLASPYGLAVDSAGALYIADESNNRIRKVSGGTITTVAGGGNQGLGDGGPATSASLSLPLGVAVDSAGNLYIADWGDDRIRKVSGGTITTFAGGGNQGLGDGGPATSASLALPAGVAVDLAGNVYIADSYNSRIRKVSGGTIATVAGNGAPGFSGDGGPATGASLFYPFGVAVDSSGNLYIFDTFNERIRKVSAGTIATVAGNGFAGYSGDGGPATSAELNLAGGSFNGGVGVDSAGNLYIADTFNQRIRKVSGGTITTVAGNGNGGFSGDGGPATNASLFAPSGVAVDSVGNLYIADTSNNRIRKLSGGTITTVAGNGNQGFSGDGGPATSASLYTPSGVAVDLAGSLYIADSGNSRIRKVSGETITTVAGNGSCCFSGDGGPATSASLADPSAVAVDSAGNLYIADTTNYRIRKVSGGTITTVAGNGTFGFSGDGGPATGASLNWPVGVAVDSAGDLYIADEFNNRIRKVSGGTITTVAGNGTCCFSGDGGPATSASLSDPEGVGVDSAGDLYIADSVNWRVRKVSGGTIATVAGNGNQGFSGDGGPATGASLNLPVAVALDSAGNLYIADNGNNRIREVLAGAVSYQVAPASLSFSGIAGGNAPVTQTINLSSSIAGLAFTASSSAAWLSVNPSSGSMPAVLGVSVNPASLSEGTHQGTITIAAPYAVPSAATVAVTLMLGVGAPAPLLAVDTQNVSFAATQGSGALTQQLNVLNAGGGSLSFTASATTTSGGSWLSISAGNGTATPSSPAALTVTATPGSLAPGTYSGTIAIAGAGSTINVPATLSVSAPTAVILVSQTGLSFTAVAQGGVPLPQNFGILNTGQGAMSWSATASTLSGGNWLQITPTSGTVQQPYLDVSPVSVSINASGLAAGTYYGRIQVSAAAANTPQVLTVILTVLPAGSSLGPQLFPTGLVFTGVAGVTPGSQDVQAGNPGGQAISFQSGQIGAGFSFLPTNASLQPGVPTTVRVFPDFSNLTAGSIQQGTITLQFSDRSPSQTINVLIVVAPAGSTAAAAGADDAGDGSAERGYRIKLGPAAASGCQSQAWSVQFRSLQANFSAVVGQATTVEVQITDGCGNPVGPGGQSAYVAATMSNGDPLITMTHIGNGNWQGTWKPANAAAGGVTLYVTALGPSGVGGQNKVSGAVLAAGPTPTVSAQGVVQAASEQGGVPITPGGLIAVYGGNLSDGVGQSTSLPLLRQLNGTQVQLGNQTLPILYTSAGQLNVQVPYGVGVNTQLQLTVQHGSTLSLPESLVVAAAAPGIFTLNESGTGQGIIMKSDGVTLAQPATPANIGETVVIYCTGLGAVTPAVTEGSPAPFSPLAWTVNPVTVTIGGVAAPAPSFNGLTPGLAGLYQVNVAVPAGIATGDAVPVTLSVAGQSSPAVTIAVR